MPDILMNVDLILLYCFNKMSKSKPKSNQTISKQKNKADTGATRFEMNSKYQCVRDNRENKSDPLPS